MGKLKIGIVEDELVIGETISLTLRKLDYETTSIADNYNSALIMIETEKPDLLLIDIMLKGKKDGIDVAHYVRENYVLPIIFLTANSDIATIERAKQVKPNAYLVKPFSKADLFAAIEISLANHVSMSNSTADSILVKDGYNYVKIFLKEIAFLTSHQNYVTVTLNTNKRIMIRSTISEMEARLPGTHFLKINRGNIINKNYVTKIETNKIFIGVHQFSISKPARDVLVKMMEK